MKTYSRIITFVFALMYMLCAFSVACAQGVSTDEVPLTDVLHKGLYRSEETICRKLSYQGIVLMQYDMYCYVHIGDTISSTCYRTDVTTVSSEKVIDAAKDDQYNCTTTYIENGRYHCTITYTDYIDQIPQEISFDLIVGNHGFTLDNLETTETDGQETFVEGFYRIMP